MTATHENPPQSRTDEALDWLEANPTQSAYVAAQRFSISQSSLSRGKKLRYGAPVGTVQLNGSKQSRTAEVLAWLDANPNESGYTASHRFGIAQSVISRAKKARADRVKKLCVECRQPIPSKTSRTEQALQWLEKHPDKTRMDAAALYGLASQVLYARGPDVLRAQRCGTCGQISKTHLPATE